MLKNCQLAQFVNWQFFCTFAPYKQKNTQIMPYTITVINDTPQALAYVEKAKKLNFVKVTKTKDISKKKTALAKPTRILTPKEEKFKKMLMQGLKELDDYRNGKIEFQDLDDFLNEI